MLRADGPAIVAAATQVFEEAARLSNLPAAAPDNFSHSVSVGVKFEGKVCLVSVRERASTQN